MIFRIDIRFPAIYSIWTFEFKRLFRYERYEASNDFSIWTIFDLERFFNMNKIRFPTWFSIYTMFDLNDVSNDCSIFLICVTSLEFRFVSDIDIKIWKKKTQRHSRKVRQSGDAKQLHWSRDLNVSGLTIGRYKADISLVWPMKNLG